MTEQITSRGFAARDPKSPLSPYTFQRRKVGANDVLIEIDFCGVCHSDIHQARNEWGGSIYPMVPGHEIVGRVKQVGSNVKKFKIGDVAGVGCLVDSCRTCGSCSEGLEQFCEGGFVGTYNSKDKNGDPTYGGYSDCVVVDEKYTLKIPNGLSSAGAAPLLCAGITTYSPLRHWKVSKGQKVGIVGLGGLGHMGVKLAASMGANVAVFTTSEKKREDAKRLGAKEVILSKNETEMKKHAASFDFILDTVSATHDINAYLPLLKRDASMVLVGLPEKNPEVQAFHFVLKRRSLAGSLIGGIQETQEMLDYCGKHKIESDIEIIPIQKINEAYERMIKGDVKYRFVIDMKSLKGD